MRKRISLYIDGNKADLGDQALVLMDYAVTDIEKPTAVRNTCSKQITLPGTPANDIIFNHAGRPDRDVTPGTFNPLQRTPYTIYSETDELIGSGYVKLDRVNRHGSAREYVVTLYGGLGSLLYGLMYDTSGEALSLASLTYDEPDASFYFSMNKASVAAAWKRLYDGTGPAMWDIVNFAPCYNGVPSKDFAADKARLQGDYENIVTLSRKYVEWETRDLRARLQRPAVRVKKIFDAIVAKAATLGKTLTLDAAFFNSSNPYYEDAWMLLPSLTTYEDSGAGQIGEPSLVDAETLDEVIAEVPMGGYAHLTGQTFSTDAGGVMDFSGFDPSFYLKGGITVRLADINNWYEYNYYLSYYDTTDSKWHGTLVGLQVSVVNEANNIDLAKSDICVFGRAGVVDTRLNDLLSYFGPEAHFWGSNGPGMAYFSFDNLQVAASPDVRIYVEFIAVSDIEGAGDDEFSLYEQETSAGRPTYATSKMTVKSVDGRFALQSPGSIGTGTTVTKAMLLSNTCTPADFLLSYCRQFGLFVVERDPGNVSVLTRQNFYHQILPQLDLTKRVDVGDVRVSPLSFSKKWQDFRLDTPVTDPEDYYERTYGRKFGDIALDTGQEFNADHEDLLAGSAFKGGVSGLWASPRMYDYDNNGLYVCPALVSGYDDNGTLQRRDTADLQLQRLRLRPEGVRLQDGGRRVQAGRGRGHPRLLQRHPPQPRQLVPHGRLPRPGGRQDDLLADRRLGGHLHREGGAPAAVLALRRRRGRERDALLRLRNPRGDLRPVAGPDLRRLDLYAVLAGIPHGPLQCLEQGDDGEGGPARPCGRHPAPRVHILVRGGAVGAFQDNQPLPDHIRSHRVRVRAGPE